MNKILLENEKKEVEEVALGIISNIRDTVEEVEKEILSEKLHIEVSGSDFEGAEIDAAASDVLNEAQETEKSEFSVMEEEILGVVAEVKKIVHDTLGTFLTRRGISLSEASLVEEEICKRLEKEIRITMKEYTEDLHEDINETVVEELEGLVEEDKFIIDRANKLGLKVQSTNSGGKEKRIGDIIGDDMKSAKGDINQYISEVTKNLADDLKQTIQDLLQGIEQDVFQENGISISENEMKKLVAMETGTS